MKLKAVLFDLHGTLFYGPDHRFLFRELTRRLKEAGASIQDSEEVEVKLASRCLRQGSREVDFEGVLRECFDGYVDQAFKLYLKLAVETRTLFDDALPTLEELSSMGFKLGAVTNALSDVVMKSIVQHLGLAKYFEEVVTSAKVGFRKPDARIFLEGLRSLGVRPREALFVGDSLLEDVNGALSAGMYAAWINRDHAFACPGPYIVLRTLKELPSLVDSSSMQASHIYLPLSKLD